jgi:hypothetical protein
LNGAIRPAELLVSRSEVDSARSVPRGHTADGAAEGSERTIARRCAMRFVQRGLAAALLVSAMACSSSSTPNAGSTGSTHAATTSSGPSTTTDPKAAAHAGLEG